MVRYKTGDGFAHIKTRNIGFMRKGTEVNMCFEVGVWELGRDPSGESKPHDFNIGKFLNGEPDI